MRVIRLLLAVLLLWKAAYCFVRQDAMGDWVVHIDSCSNKEVSGKNFNTTFPSTLHLDLLRNSQIPDPYFADNYEALRWVS